MAMKKYLITEGDYSSSQVDSAVQKAEASFWQTIGDEFPKVTSGIIDPNTETELLGIMTKAVKDWIKYTS